MLKGGASAYFIVKFNDRFVWLAVGQFIRNVALAAFPL